MLVLTRKKGEGVIIGDDIEIQIVDIRGGAVRVGLNAPRDKKIYRQEVYQKIQEENREATKWKVADLDSLLNAQKTVVKETK